MLLVGLLALAAFTGPRLTALRRFVVDVPHRGVEGNVTRMRPFTLRTGDFADHARVGVRAQENIKWWAALIASAAVSLAILNNVFRRVRQNQIMVSSDDSDSEAELFA